MPVTRERNASSFWDEAEDVADRINLPDDVRPMRNRRPPAALQDFLVEVNIEENFGQAGFDDFVRDVYEIVEKVNEKLRKRFNEKNIVSFKVLLHYAQPLPASYIKTNLWLLQSCLMSIQIVYATK